jgi:hypothetical protein
LEKFVESYLVLLYNVFFAIVSKMFFLHQNYLVILKLIFFLTEYRVHGEVVDGNFSLIGEYSSTVKNQQKYASVPPSRG